MLKEKRNFIRQLEAIFYTLEFEMPKVYRNNTDPEIGESGVIQIEPELTCIRDVLSGTTGYDIKATLLNLTEVY